MARKTLKSKRREYLGHKEKQHLLIANSRLIVRTSDEDLKENYLTPVRASITRTESRIKLAKVIENEGMMCHDSV